MLRIMRTGWKADVQREIQIRHALLPLFQTADLFSYNAYLIQGCRGSFFLLFPLLSALTACPVAWGISHLGFIFIVFVAFVLAVGG